MGRHGSGWNRASKALRRKRKSKVVANLFMPVSAPMGLETMRAAYAHAIRAGYRFYSYDDGSPLLPPR